MDSHARYLVTLAATALALTLAMAGVVRVGLLSGALSPAQHVLLAERKTRLAAGPTPVVLFVGDSTLGYAVSPGIFEAETGLSAGNAALTGLFGYAGSLNMLRIAERGGPLDIVVLLHATDMLSRPPARIGGPLSDPERGPLDEARMTLAAFSFANLRAILRGVLRPQPAPALVDGFIPQGSPGFRERPEAVAPRQVDPEKLAELRAVGDFCAARGLRCLYVHGPFWDEACALSDGFLRAADAAIREAGLTLAGGPLCLPRAMLGDTPDHVRPDLTPEITRRYAALLGPHLSRPAAIRPRRRRRARRGRAGRAPGLPPRGSARPPRATEDRSGSRRRRLLWPASGG